MKVKAVKPKVEPISPRLRTSQEFMEGDLAKSGLTPADIGAYAHAYAENQLTRIRLGGQLVSFAIGRDVVAAYRFPYYSRDGKPLISDYGAPLMYRERRLYADHTDPQIKKRKYDQPSRHRIGELATIPYFHPQRLANRGKSAYAIHEGEKKHACAVKVGQDGCSIGGNFNWRDPNDPNRIHHELLADIEDARAACGVANTQFVINLWPDGDLDSYFVQLGWGEFARKLIELGYTVVMMDLSKIGPKAKFDDEVAAQGIEWVMSHVGTRDIATLVESQDTLHRQFPGLHRWPMGEGYVIAPLMGNVTLLLKQHPAFAGKIWRDLDTMRVMLGDEVAEEGVFEVNMLAFFERQLGFNKRGNRITLQMLKQAIGAVAAEQAKSSFEEYLRTLKWDGKPRLDDWIVRLCHCEDTPFAREAGKRFLIGLVGRTFDPGCAMRWILVIKGPQKIGKTGLPEVFVGATMVAQMGMQEKKDIALAMHSAKIVNHDELETLDRRGLRSLKQDLSAKVDSFRVPYEATSHQWPRRFVQYGSVNESEFLANDPSGNNRWVIVEASERKFDFSALYAERAQLLAEARVRHDEGYEFDVVPGADEVAKRYEIENVWEVRILEAYRDGKFARWESPAVKAAMRKHPGKVIAKGDAIFAGLGVAHGSGAAYADMKAQWAIGDALRALGFVKDEHICRPGKSWVIEKEKLDAKL